MNNRFKFRVWKGQENRMVYEVTYLNPLILDPSIKEENKHNILMQCTGLKDKNGKLIYEGDIVQWGKTNFAVVWQSCQYALKKDINEKPIDFSLTSFNGKEIEAIGNIYENPEALN